MSKHNKTKQELILELEELKQKYDSLERVYLSDIESHKKIDKEFFHQQAEELLSKKTEDSGFKIPESDILKLNHELQTHQVELELQNEELLRVTSSLQQNESQYKSLFANNHSVMLLIDPETGEIKDANVAACFYYGWSHGELCKKNISDINTLSSDELAKELQRAKAEKRKHFFFKHCLANGEVRDVEIYSGPIHYGGTTLLYSLVHDITGRKIAEEKLHESEEKYSKAFQTSPYAIGITRLSDGKFLEVNDAFTTISGYSREEILANTVGPDFWVNPEDRNEMTKLLAEGNEVSGKEYQFRNKSGGIITGIFSAQIISLENEPYMLSSINDISAHKMAEDAQHESNALYKAIIHASPDNITITDLEGKVLFSSPKALEMFGFENMDQLINHHLIEFIVPEDRERAQSEIIKMHQGNDSGATSYRAKKADDTIIDIDVNGEFIRDENGTPTRMIFIVRDITERKKTEKALQLSEEKYRSIFETMLDVYYEAGLDGKVIDISPSIELISKGQYTRNELIGKQIAEVYSDIEDQEAFLSEIAKSGKVTDYELLLKNKDGLNIQVSISAGLILDKKGHPVKIVGTMRDITERKQTQEALIKNKIRLQQMAEQSGTVIWEIDSTGMYTYVSPVSKQVWDYSPEELVGKKHFYDLHPKEGREEFKLIALQAISKKEIFKEFPNQVLTKSNKLIWVSTNGVPILDHEGNLIGYRGADYDITDSKLAENALNDKNNLLTNLIVNMQEGILLEDAERKIALTNQLFCNMFSIPAPPEVMIGADCTSSAEESKHFFKNPDKFIADINLILANKKAVFNDALELVDGRHLQRDYIPTYLENQYSGHLWKYRDITNLKLAEERMRKLSQSIEQSPVMTYITGTSGLIEYVNPIVFEITGYSADELLGQNPRIFGSGERPKEEYKELWQTITSGKEWKGEFHNKKKNGELYWVSSSISAVSDDSGNITHFLAIQEDITNRKQSEKEILELNASLEQKVKDRTAEFKEALNRLNKIADRVPGMVYQYLLRPDGTSCFPYSSEGINDIYRVNPQEVADDASPVFANLHPDDFDGVAESIQASASNLEVWQDEYRVKFDDGTIRWLSGNATPQKEADGSILWHGFITDVTQHKQEEEELALEKQRLDSIIQGTNVGTWEWNIQTGETIFNERWADIIGYTLEEISPVSIETWMKFTHPDDLKVSGELLEQHFKGELDYYSFESRMKHKNGHWVWVLDRGKVSEWDTDGKPLIMSGTHQNITERKQAVEEIEESREKHRGLSEAAFDSIFFSEKGICIQQNLMAEKVFGYTTEEAIGRYGTDWIIPEHRKIVMDNMMTGFEEPYEVTALRKDGTTFPCMLSGKMMNYKGRNVRVTSLNDITELKLAEEELKWNQSLLNYMSNSSPLGLLVVDNRNDDILYFNHRFCEIWEIQAIEEQMQGGEFKNNDIIPYCLPVLADVPAYAESCEPLQYEDNRIVLEDEISFTENRTVRRFSTQIRGKNDEYFGRFYIFEDISNRKRADKFENELLQLSMLMTATKSEDIPVAINNALTKIGSFLFADRAYIFEINKDGSNMNNSYEWCNDGINPEIENLQDLPVSIFPMWMKSLLNKENIQIPSVKDLPESWSAEREILEPQGIQSLVVIPILNHNQLIGFVGLDSVKSMRKYNESEINNLRVWANMMAGILNKQKAEHILTQTRINYETFFNTIDDFLFVLNEGGNIIHTNNIVINRLGYSTRELMDQSVLMVHPPERREEAGRIVGEMLAGTSEFCPVPLVTKSGEYIPVETRVKPGFWDGKPVIFGVTKDVSQIKLSEEKFSRAFQTNSALMAISDLDGTFIDVNDTFLKVLGFSREEVIGHTSLELNILENPDFRNSIADYLEQNIAARDIELNIRTKSGEIRFGLFSADSIYIGKDKCLLTMMVDITERKLAEAEILKAKNEAENGNRAKSEFLSRMSHELRTPLNSILGFAQLMEMSDLIPSHKKRLNHILSNGKHLLKLINEVLDIAGIESGKQMMNIEPVLLIDMINQAMDVIQGAAHKRGVTIELVDAPSNNFFVMADKLRLKQVLLNLLSNAVKYNDEKGLVKIKTELQPLDASGNAMVRLSISDTGIGINPDNISKLFQSFERIGADKTEIEGTGLGLMLVRKFAEAMGGAVGVESKPDVGSTFWVDLPQTENKDNVKIKIEGVEEGAAIQEDAKVATILYIEDNLSNIELVEEILADHRPSIQLVTSIYGGKTIKLAKEYLPKLILLDLNLPDMKGDEVLKKLLADSVTKTIPVIMVSANAIPSQIKKLMKIGAVNYLTKPLDIIQFLKNVDQYTEI